MKFQVEGDVDGVESIFRMNPSASMVGARYIKADKIVNRFLTSVEEDTLVMCISDHGFSPVHKEVVVNNYLDELGFLKMRNEKIDLERSKAVSYGYGDIWLNVKEREPNGLIRPGKEYEVKRNEIANEINRIQIDG